MRFKGHKILSLLSYNRMMNFKNGVFRLLLVFLFLAPFRLVSQQVLDAPPAGTIRTAAEWEEIQALVVTWTSYKSVLAEIIRYAQEECRVIVHTSNPATAQSELLNNYGVVIGPNVTFLTQPFDRLWIRDYGANSAYIGDVDSLFLVDWKYNRPSRPKDDTLPRAYARELNLNLVQTIVEPDSLEHTGGNYMSDGFGTAFSSKLVLNENNTKTEAEIDGIMQEFMGIDRYIKMETLPYDGINHIDMHMKLLDEETLLMAKYPAGVSDGPQIEANLLYVLDNFNSVFGTPYKVVRVVSPPDGNNDYPNAGGDYWTYANAVFVNKTVLVPIYSQTYDTTALRVYRENLPGYRVIGIPCNSIISAGGAIHCITHSVGVNDPLLISHQQHADTYDTQNPYQLNARIQHRSGIAQATLYWATDTLLEFNQLPMTLIDEANHTWSAAIPAQLAGAKIYYYIYAIANSGKSQLKPMPAPQGKYKFTILETGTGISNGSQVTGLFSLRAFPNPSSGITCIPVNSNVPLKLDLAVYDITGRLVQQLFNGETRVGENRYYINSADWVKGVYVIRAATNAGIKVEKLIVE